MLARHRDGGLIVVTFDEGSDAAACSGENSGLGSSHTSVSQDIFGLPFLGDAAMPQIRSFGADVFG